MNLFPPFLTFSLITLTAVALQAQVNCDFDSSQVDVEEQFISPGVISSSWNATAGVGGTGGLLSDATVRPTYFKTPQTTLKKVGASISMSLDFQGRNAKNSAYGGTVVALGISSGTKSTLTVGSEEFLSVGVNDLSSAPGDGNARLVIQTRSATAEVAVGDVTNTVGTATLSVEKTGSFPNSTRSTGEFTESTSDFVIAERNWYRLTCDIKQSDDNYFLVSASLYNLGPNGDSSPVQIGGANEVSVANPTLLNAASFYYGFSQIAQNLGGIYAVDNFKVAPKPSAKR